MSEAIAGLTVLLGAVAVLLGTPRALRRLQLAPMTVRAITHVLVGVLISGGILFSHRPLAVAAVMAAAIPGTVCAIERGWIAPIMAGTRLRDYGFATYLLGILILAFLFLPNQLPVIVGIVALAVADPAAAIIGGRYGAHQITVWRSTRSIEGTIACAACLAVVAAIGLLAADASLDAILLGTALIAFTGSLVELVSPSAADNALIPIWVGVLTFEATRSLGVGEQWRWLASIVVGLPLIPGLVRLGWLDAGGSILAVLVGSSAFALGGPVWILPGLAFFATTSLLPKVTGSEHAGEPRGVRQAVVNCLVPTLPLIGYLLTGGSTWTFLYVGGVSAACADTWASEVGRLSGAVPRSLRSWRPVQSGESGGLTVLGTLASFAGAAVVGLVASALVPHRLGLPILLTALACGVIGSLIDSALGAYVQVRWRCQNCDTIFERRHDCEIPYVRRASGVTWVDNDVVNGATNMLGAAIALLIYGALFWPA
jgi:uncharacterized protein (TIGR00297 family)